MTKRRILVLIVTALAAVAAIAALVWLPVGAALERFAESVRAAGDWGPLVLATLYVVATVFFIPGGLLTLLAGFLFGVVKGAVTVASGSIVGAMAAFWLGRGVAHDWVQRRFAASETFQAIDAVATRQSFKLVLLVRLSPIFPFVFTNYAFSLTKIRFRDFLLASAIGMLPATVLYVYLGSLARSLAELARGDVGGAGLRSAAIAFGLLASAALVFITARAARSALRETLQDEAR